jgi:hypothetical protein
VVKLTSPSTDRAAVTACKLESFNFPSLCSRNTSEDANREDSEDEAVSALLEVAMMECDVEALRSILMLMLLFE